VALTSITDPKNQTTTVYRDTQGRVYQKVSQDGTRVDYLYEGQTAPNTIGATSRLQSSTDAKNQRTNYVYFADDNIQQITYTNIAGQPLTPPTASVSYIYDPNRIISRVSVEIEASLLANRISIQPTSKIGIIRAVNG
jgi:YD repeat-containing protein